MSMTVTMSAESAATETPIADAAIVRPLPVRSWPGLRAAIAAAHETHRYRTEGRGAHQRQHNAARTFHGSALGMASEAMELLRHSRRKDASESASFHGIVRRENMAGRQPPPEKCDVNACANAPKPPRVTPEPDSDDEVPVGERLDEESPLKKLLREDDPPDQPWPLDEDPRGEHPAAAGDATMPGRFGSQFPAGISA
jgi:hypothetical protein